MDALANRATSVFDAANRLIATIDPLANRTTFSHSAVGQQTVVLDANGNRTPTASMLRGERSTCRTRVVNDSRTKDGTPVSRRMGARAAAILLTRTGGGAKNQAKLMVL